MTEQPIGPVASAITAFVGGAPAGPVCEPRLVTSMSHFTRLYGGLWRESHLGYSVRDYFRHGGRMAVIVRTDPDADITRSQLGGLRQLRDQPMATPSGDPIALLVVPPGGVDSHGWVEPTLDVLREAVATAEELSAFAVLDAPAAWAGMTDPVGGAADVLESLRTSYAAMYFPQLVEVDPLTGELLAISPSGAVAGIIARTDAQYGPWNAPAGTATTALDVDGLTVSLGPGRTEALAQLRINAIRSFPGTGPLVWGARALGTDPEWAYVPTRRMAILLEQSIARGLRWATFEPNAEPLWGRVRVRVEEFLHQLFRSGAFPGSKPEEGFFVRCDRSTMTQADIDDGVLRILVGFAPTRPAEFIPLQITLAVGQAA
ncbi:MAG: phage tail sheath family protein [Intrasporangium sp.]|uniref:phage tail sheath family protein n=1 Tax=Intrasporangium sp. TaxID=1925024 RepID=UPI003F7D37A1